MLLLAVLLVNWRVHNRIVCHGDAKEEEKDYQLFCPESRAAASERNRRFLGVTAAAFITFAAAAQHTRLRAHAPRRRAHANGNCAQNTAVGLARLGMGQQEAVGAAQRHLAASALMTRSADRFSFSNNRLFYTLFPAVFSQSRRRHLDMSLRRRLLSSQWVNVTLFCERPSPRRPVGS